MNSNEAYDFEGNKYVNPTLSRDEQMQFIDNLRAVQAGNNAEIQTDTKNLGTDVPSNQGGLVGGEDYFLERYQKPQLDGMVANLRASAQAKALSTVLANLSAQYKQRMFRANLAREKRSNAGYGAGGASGGNISGVQGSVTESDPFTTGQSGKVHDTSGYLPGIGYYNGEAENHTKGK